MDIDRRDYTNQSGAQVPTESTAIHNIETYERDLAAARKLYGIFVRTCNLCGFMLTKVEIERNDNSFNEGVFRNDNQRAGTTGVL